MGVPRIEVLTDGSALLRCSRLVVRPGAEAEPAWMPCTLDLTELRLVEWGEHPLLEEATVLRTPFDNVTIDVAYAVFDRLYARWLDRRSIFRFN